MKNNTLIKLIALSLTAVTAVTMFVSCAKKGKTDEEDEVQMQEGGLEGYTLNVLSASPFYSDTPGNLMFTEEANGDTIRETVYARNNKVQSKYGLEITQTYVDSDTDMAGEIVKLTAAQDDAYQSVTMSAADCTPYISQNLFTNVANLPYINMDADYWDGDTMELLSLNGFYVALTGDILFDTYDGMLLTMYNTPLANDFGIENLYNVVNSGGWTFERQMEEMEKVITDLDNDGLYSFADRIGLLYASNNLTPFYAAGNITFITKDSSGAFTFDDSVEDKAVALTENVGKLLHSKGYALDWLVATDAFGVITGMIENKQILFQNMVLSQVRRFYREIKTDFGLLPLPKLTEEQENYSSSNGAGKFGTGGQSIVVPTSVVDLEKVGFALEALAQASSDFPNAFFHICLESKFTRDAESIDMIMLQYKNLITDPMFYYDFAGFGEALNVILANNRAYSTVVDNFRDNIDVAIEETMLIEIN